MTAGQETHPQAYAGSKFEASADDLLGVISIDVVAERTPVGLQVRDNASFRLGKIIAAEHAATDQPVPGSVGYSSTKAIQQDLEVAAIETASNGVRNYHADTDVALHESNFRATRAGIQCATHSPSERFKSNVSLREGTPSRISLSS